MASNKIRSKNDTWTSEELRMALKEEDAAGRIHYHEKLSSRKKIKDTDVENKGNKKKQDIASRRKQLREEEEEEARQLKEARKAKRAEQNAKSHILTDEEERRQKRQRAKEKALEENAEERRQRRHERKLKEGNLIDDKDEEEHRRRRHEKKLKEANQIEDKEEQRQKRHERKSKDDKLIDDHDEEARRQRRREQKTKEDSLLDEEKHRQRKQEQKTKSNAPNKDDEERRQRHHERKREDKDTEGDVEERRRQRRERKLKEKNQEDEDENERRRRQHEKRQKDGNVADNYEEERRRRRYERKLKEGKIAEEDEGDHKQRRQRTLKEANIADDEEEHRQRKQERKKKEKNREYGDVEERHHKKEQQHKKESDKTMHQSHKIKSAGDKNIDNLKKIKKSKHEGTDYENDKKREKLAKGDIKPTQFTDNLEAGVNDKSRDEESTIQDEYNYDDDDFEDYSEDFDDDSSSENTSDQKNACHEDIKNMEHSYLSSVDSNRWDSARVSSAEKSLSSVNERLSHQVMDFSHAKMQKMTQKSRSKLRSRWDDLCSLIALDVAVGQEIFELAPISEYELYIRNFGNANSNQVYVQTGDDNIDRDIQTEEIECLDKWTQHPPNGAAACGGNNIQNFNQTDFAAKSQLHDSARLNKFLLEAAQVMSILLEENLSSDTHNLTHEKSSQLPFSKSFFTLSSCPLFQEHTIDCCCFANSTHTDILLTVHNPSVVTIKGENGKTSSSSGSYIALWDLRTPSRPYKILFSDSAISCCFGSLKSQLVLAGCVDGAIVVWDLRESESLHKCVNLDDIEYCIRYPAYNTAGVLSFNSHSSIIQTICDIPLQVGRETETLVQKESFNTGFSCQLLSMDQSGLVNLWVIVELSSGDTSGSTVDLGLSPGSQIKLEHTSSINVHAAVRDSLFPTSISTQQLCLLPKDPNQIYISTDTGHVIHSVRLGSQPYPRVHSPRKVTLSSVLSHVLSLDFSPFMAPCFLTGHSDGSVNLYHTSLECPVVTWLPSQTGSQSIVSVRWSHSRPTVFYALSDRSTVFVYDLLEQDNNAICTQTYEDRLTSFNVICNSNATNSTEERKSTEKMVLCFANGRIEVHTISEVFSERQTLEVEFLENYLHRM
ncbi:WDR60 [Acanthosepion pharaonis]|uniref:WDR60 n=1 Tax=Acanthosepion pharaonis TaxID=158019 RepID=A0A812BZW0_ACAPH|nr:WDR60 [Sepia pharaonis]